MRSDAQQFTSLSLSNFRGFKNAPDIPLAPLTFLVGPNSSGKSSIFDALLLIAQSLTHTIGDFFVPNWIGPLVDLGSYTDAVFGHNELLPITIAFGIRVDPNYPYSERRGRLVTVHIEFQFRAKKHDPVGRIARIRVIDHDSELSLAVRFGPTEESKAEMTFLGRVFSYDPRFSKRPRWYGLSDWIAEKVGAATKSSSPRLAKSKISVFRRLVRIVTSLSVLGFIFQTQRVSSGRSAPKRWYPRTAVMTEPRRWIHTPRIFDSVDPGALEDRKTSDEFGFHRRPRIRIEATLASVLKQLDIAKSIEAKELSAYHSVITVRDNRLDVESKLIDVGFGASQVIPVILGCLSENAGPLLVEQPEIHLHPKAQGYIAELLCKTSLHRQVIVETHSEHMINRARIMIAKGKLHHKDVLINYVIRDHKGSRVTTIPLSPEGEFAEAWPEGFFDERFQDTLTLLNIKQQKGE